MSPLEIIGHLDVPASVMSHRFALEAYGCAKIMERNVEERESREQVVGTKNTGKVELYGWAPMVDSHVDRTGYVYLCPLNEGRSTVNVLDGENAISVFIPIGTVVRLNDFVVHWTEDTGLRVCAFIGSFEKPCDYDALIALQSGIESLARGDYYGAPRVSPGFRALMPDECMAPNDTFDDYELMLLSDAKKQKRWYERCSQCESPAVRLDNHWPYFTDKNRCAQHLFKGEK